MHKRMSKVIEPDQLASLREAYKDLCTMLSEMTSCQKMELDGEIRDKLAATIFSRARSSGPMTERTKLSILKRFRSEFNVLEK